MKQKEKNKIEKAQKVISYMDIKRRGVFGDQKTSETGAKLGAKLLEKNKWIKLKKKNLILR